MSEQTIAPHRPDMDVEQSIPVHIVRGTERPEIAEKASLFSLTLLGTEPPNQLIPQDRKRTTCVIMVRGAANNSVVLARRNGVSNNKGIVLFTGDNFTYTADSEIWYVPQSANGAVTISVCDQRYED